MSHGKCKVCKKTMDDGKGCKGFLRIDGKKYSRVRYGDKGEPTDTPCHDCNVTEGQMHHWGCDNESCPKCGGQALGCECPEKYEIITETRTISYIEKLRKESTVLLSVIVADKRFPNNVPKSKQAQFLREAKQALKEKFAV